MKVGGISFGTTEARVLEKLGTPTEVGGARVRKGKQVSWSTYVIAGLRLRFGFEDGVVDEMSVGLPKD